MDSVRYAEEIRDRLEEAMNKEPSLIKRQDLAYYHTAINDLLKRYQQLEEEISGLERRLEGVTVDEDVLEATRTEVEDQISYDILEGLRRDDPQAYRDWMRLNRLKRLGLTPKEQERYEQIKEEYLETINYTDGEFEEGVSYELPNGIVIWLDLMDTLKGWNPGRVAQAYVVVNDRRYQLPLRPEFLERLQELYEETGKIEEGLEMEERLREHLDIVLAAFREVKFLLTSTPFKARKLLEGYE